MELTYEKFNWSARIGRGVATEQRFVKHVQNEYGFYAVQTSQHNNQETDKHTRHFPDIFIKEWRAFIQVKDGLRSGPHQNVIAEIDSIDACQELNRMGNKVWVIWEYPDRSWYGNDIKSLVTAGEISLVARKNGSGTPAYKIRKTSLKPLVQLVDISNQLSFL